MGKAATKWTDKLSLWESLLALGFFYPRRSSAGQARANYRSCCSCLLLHQISFSRQQERSETRAQPEEPTSTRGGQRLRSTERHGGTKPLSAQRDLPRHRSAPKSCTRCLLPTAQLGYRPRHQQLLCFEVRPQPRRHIASACLTAVPKCCLSRQGRSPCLWTHFWAHLLLQAKPATLLVPSAAVLCRGEMRSSKNCAVSLEVNSD